MAAPENSGQSPPEPQGDGPVAPRTQQPRLIYHFFKGVSGWFWEMVGVKAAGDTMTEHALTVERKGRFLAMALIFCICCITIGVGLRGCYDELKGVEAENHDLSTALAVNQSALNSERVENEKLKRQHSDDQVRISDLRSYNAGLPHKESPAELMGFHDQTNVVVLTNWMLAVVTQTNILSLIPTPFSLDFFQLQRIQNQLKLCPAFLAHIVCLPDDPNGFTVARQLTQVFMSANFNASCGTTTNALFFTNAIAILANNKPSQQSDSVFTSISRELNQNLQWWFSTYLPTNEVWIYINRK